MPLSFYDLIDESIETDFSINGKMEWILSTDFSTNEFNEIFNKYKDMDYPIVLDSGKPIVKDGELVRDVTDIETKEFNDTMALYRLASQLKLIVKNTDIQEMEIEDIIAILKETSLYIYMKLQKDIAEIIKAKFHYLPHARKLVARKSLALTDKEKIDNDNFRREISQRKEQLYRESDKIQMELENCKDNKRINELTIRLTEIEAQIKELDNAVSSDINDGVKLENGVTDNFVILECQKEFNWDVSFTIRVLKQTLSKDEEAYVELCKAKYSLQAERDERAYKKMK